MADLQTLQLAHLPPDLLVHVALYQDLRNAPFLRQQLLNGNSEYEYAFIDASVITSTTHVLAAVFRAANEFSNKRLKSRNVHSEIVFSLSPNNNVRASMIRLMRFDGGFRLSHLTKSTSPLPLQIAESFRRFGITDMTSSLLVIKLSTSPEITHQSVQRHLRNAIEGTAVDFSDEELKNTTDMARVKKIYKLSAQAQGTSKKAKDGSGALTEKAEGSELEVIVLGLMALRGAN